MLEKYHSILAHFPLDGSPVSCQSYGCGHINSTFLIITDRGRRYILQKINQSIFRDPAALMQNIVAVTAHLRTKTTDPRAVLTVIPDQSGASFCKTESGEYWRIYEFVKESICLQAPETPEDFYQSAVGFGRFQQLLLDFPAHTLAETIPHFHDTPNRYRNFHEALQKDPLGRAKEVLPEIEFALAREAEAGTVTQLLAAGQLPLRVTHNDTKLNNVLLDAKTRTALCVIDLDTVMPGSSLYDFGDSIRFGAASVPEDYRTPEDMILQLDLYETFTRGFLSACPGLTDTELEYLPMGAKLMTMECGIRFLTDYLEGDHYFSIHRPGQNLDRCRTQFHLVANMEEKWARMHQIIQKLTNR